MTALTVVSTEGPVAPRAPQIADYFNEKPLATPATRKLARDLGVDLRRVAPTGAHGRVTKDDVRASSDSSFRASSDSSLRAFSAETPQSMPAPPIARPVEGLERPPVRPPREELTLPPARASSPGMAPAPVPAEDVPMQPVKVEKTPGRNEPCYCGSGKKFKHCHGR